MREKWEKAHSSNKTRIDWCIGKLFEMQEKILKLRLVQNLWNNHQAIERIGGRGCRAIGLCCHLSLESQGIKKH